MIDGGGLDGAIPVGNDWDNSEKSRSWQERGREPYCGLFDWLQAPSETFGHVVVHPAPAHRLRDHPMQVITRLQTLSWNPPFFTRLPREVRDLVYDYLWCDGLHILQYGRFRYTVTYVGHHDAQPPTHAAAGLQAGHGRSDLPRPHAAPTGTLAATALSGFRRRSPSHDPTARVHPMPLRAGWPSARARLQLEDRLVRRQGGADYQIHSSQHAPATVDMTAQ
ncbi:hypothetical protein K458DRAFT_425372 [Lentithecium fluviatile CBS 122367]|uniref:Uncharacterized protein n=1 Tax=Lentithecium fluviatile CBS 122367 TaxID=1168545 RepID=A0A6G1JMJ9_9PLEO|nr:hypothetical protein K458DRAFT_425372 [Lentithecium fluviatile CBS 122367]